MKRTLMQIYVKGSKEAAAFYQRAFHAELKEFVEREDGAYYHSELDVYGQILAIAERDGEDADVTGNVMQFCLHFEPGEESRLTHAYEVLKEGAEILAPLAACNYADFMTDLVDKYGVRWCLFLIL